VRVLIPGYREVVDRDDMTVVGRLDGVAALPACELGRIETADGLIVYAVLCPEFYEREGAPYADTMGADWPDNDLRFARLGLTAAEFAAGLGDPDWRPDLLHLNDWPSALAAAYLAWRNRATPSILTIHNLAYQGLFDRDRLPLLGIPEEAFAIEGVEFHGKISFLKAGLQYASHLTTVSTTYAKEITTAEHGCGLDGLLRLRAVQGRLTGIVNGIDDSWNPLTDPHLADHFDVNDWDGKQANAAHVRQAFNLAVSRGPLFAIVSRLCHQKGVDLAVAAAETIVGQGGQIVVTGRGERWLESALQSLAARHPGAVGVRIGFDEAEAHRMFAGSDFLLMPSRFEPCGLSQMYAQRCGSLPIAHKTGGLAETIEDGITGFLFPELSLNDLLGAVWRGLEVFGSRSRLDAMRRAAMTQPLSWRRSAKAYGAVYTQQLTALA
jgi:starch synthase